MEPSPDPVARAIARVDLLFLGELALELHMPVGKMLEQMDLHELVSFWPAFFRDRHEQEVKRRQSEENARRSY
jgi:hypothetical protein